MPTLSETFTKVTEFAELPHGWHHGEGVPATREAIQQAHKFLNVAEFAGLSRANAFPGGSGQIAVTFYNEDHVLELTIETDGTITIAEDYDNEQIDFVEGASVGDAYRRLQDFAQSIWTTSESFTANISIRNVAGLQASHSTWQPDNLFLLLDANVRSPRADRSAPTSRDTTRNKRESRRSTGTYHPASSPHQRDTNPRQVPPEIPATSTFTDGPESRRRRHSRLSN